jgi:hypothetical protein
MVEETRAAKRMEILFGDGPSDPTNDRRNAAQRVQSMSLSDSEMATAYVATLLHDVGHQHRPSAAKPSQSLAMWMWSFLRRSEQRTVETLNSRSNLALSTCMDLMRRLVQAGRTRGARQYLHEIIDDLLLRGQFATVDALLFSADPLQDDPRILITLLTATKPAKERLRLRDDFFGRTADALKQRNVDEPGLLTGLE